MSAVLIFLSIIFHSFSPLYAASSLTRFNPTITTIPFRSEGEEGVKILFELRVDEVLSDIAIRFTEDDWKTKKDIKLQFVSEGKYQVVLGPYPQGTKLSFAVFAYDWMAGRLIWAQDYQENSHVLIDENLPLQEVNTSHLRTNHIGYLYEDLIPLIYRDIDVKKENFDFRPIFRRKVRAALDQHWVYVSLTTSPERIHSLKSVIERLGLKWINRIFLTLPRKYGRDGSTYTLPDWVRYNPNIQILEIEEDLGPITKLIPAVEYLKKFDPSAWLITIDDDIHYHKSFLSELIQAKVYHPDAIISGSGQKSDFWGIPFENFPGRNMIDLYKPRSTAISSVDIIEGFAGVIYDIERIDTKQLKEMSRISKEAYLSDDLVISYFLAQNNIPRLKFNGRYYQVEQIEELEIGKDQNALHLGAELTHESSNININAMKYRKAFESIETYKNGTIHCMKFFENLK